MSAFKSLDTVWCPVADMDRAVAFYRDQLGLSIAFQSQYWTSIKLEGGIQIDFSGGSYRSGDFWHLPARTATRAIEWPEPNFQPPASVERHFCRLAIINVVQGAVAAPPTDCRRVFLPLTEIPGPDSGLRVVQVRSRDANGATAPLVRFEPTLEAAIAAAHRALEPRPAA